MEIRALLAAASALVAACDRDHDQAASPPVAPEQAAEMESTPVEPSGWDLQSSGEGVALVLASARGGTAIRLFCPAGENRLLVNVPSFKPIGSEERLSFGGGGDAVALVADPSGDSARGGVSGSGAVPGDLAALVSGGPAASYGAQSSGPHPAPPADLVRAFAAACGEVKLPKAVTPQRASACLMQDGQPVRANRLRAIGTEPFWGARIDGRCVTYSHPDDQKGTLVWTRFVGTARSGTWTGNLGGSPFILRTRPEAGCSDGMSDRRYPIAVTLTVSGEQRTGCAEPL